MHSIIAFANTAGGVMVVGIDDGAKHVRGLADPLKEAALGQIAGRVPVRGRPAEAPVPLACEVTR